MKFLVADPLEDLSDVAPVEFQRVRVYEYVVQVNDDEEVCHVLERVVHEVLEMGWGIGWAKRHNKPFVGAVSCSEGEFPFMPFGDAHIVVPGSEVYFGVYFSAAESV
jgi:hypothetical protein